MLRVLEMYLAHSTQHCARVFHYYDPATWAFLADGWKNMAQLGEKKLKECLHILFISK